MPAPSAPIRTSPRASVSAARAGQSAGDAICTRARDAFARAPPSYGDRVSRFRKTTRSASSFTPRTLTSSNPSARAVTYDGGAPRRVACATLLWLRAR